MSSYVIYLYIYMFIGLLLIRCLLSVVRTIYSVSTLCVYLRCPLLVLLLSVKLGVSALRARYYLLGVYFLWCVLLTSVYFRRLLCVLLLSVFRRNRGVYFRCSVLPASGPRASTSRLSVKMEVSTSGGPYILHGVYFPWSVLSTRCLLSVSTLRASTLRHPSRTRCLLSVSTVSIIIIIIYDYYHYPSTTATTTTTITNYYYYYYY